MNSPYSHPHQDLLFALKSLGLPADASAAELARRLEECPAESAARYLHAALPEGFADLTDRDEINDALTEAFRAGSTAIDRAFADALTKFAEENDLVGNDGSPIGTVQIDDFGEPFNLWDCLGRADLPPFTEKLISDLADGWAWKNRGDE